MSLLVLQCLSKSNRSQKGYEYHIVNLVISPFRWDGNLPSTSHYCRNYAASEDDPSIIVIQHVVGKINGRDRRLRAERVNKLPNLRNSTPPTSFHLNSRLFPVWAGAEAGSTRWRDHQCVSCAAVLVIDLSFLVTLHLMVLILHVAIESPNALPTASLVHLRIGSRRGISSCQEEPLS